MVRLNKIYSPIKFFVYTIINILIAYTLFGICRLVFFISNLDYFPNIESNNVLDIINGAFVFDTAGIIYMNIIYILLMLIPLPWRETKLWQKISKLIFIVTNSIALILNFIDVVYFRYTNRRTTASVFSEFDKEDNIVKLLVMRYLTITFW